MAPRLNDGSITSTAKVPTLVPAPGSRVNLSASSSGVSPARIVNHDGLSFANTSALMARPMFSSEISIPRYSFGPEVGNFFSTTPGIWFLNRVPISVAERPDRTSSPHRAASSARSSLLRTRRTV